MILAIANSKIKLEADTLGAQMMTLTDNSYSFEGKVHPMGTHRCLT